MKVLPLCFIREFPKIWPELILSEEKQAHFKEMLDALDFMLKVLLNVLV